MRLHSTRNVHGIAPQVVDEFAFSNDAGDHGPCMDANSHRELVPSTPVDAIDDIEHIERKSCNRLRVIRTMLRKPCGDHICVADRFDFLQTVTLGQVVEFREYPIQEVNEFCGGKPSRKFGKTDEVRKKDAYFGKPISNDAFSDLRRVAIDMGRMLCKSPSERSCSRARSPSARRVSL